MDDRASQIGIGIFFIGMGLLFMTGWWWPGIMFVLAATVIARSVAAGGRWQNATGIWWMLGIGILFGVPGLFGDITGSIWKLFPLIMIGMGLFVVFGGKCGICGTKSKREDDDIHHV